MIHFLIIKFLVVLYCTSTLALDYYALYPVANKQDCAFPFDYRGKSYTDCTTDGDNGDIPWCSLTKDYLGYITYCFDFRNTTATCLPSFTMPNGRTYTAPAILSSTALYKQCKTSYPGITYRFYTDAMASPTLPSVINKKNCDPKYASLAPDHCMCYGPSPFAVPVTLNSTNKQALLDIHNSYRASVSTSYMFKLYWNDELAKISQAHANLCRFEHDLASNRVSPLFGWLHGQNIVMSTETRSTLSSLIDMMLGSEKKNFVYGSGCSPGDDTCLHYTQAMISNITHVGCALSDCVYPHGIERFLTCTFLLAQYQDNYRTPYVPSDTPASGCPAKNSSGLCDCGNIICQYSKNEYLDPATCTCKGSTGKRSIDKRDDNDDELEKYANNEVKIRPGHQNPKSPSKREIKTIPIHHGGKRQILSMFKV